MKLYTEEEMKKAFWEGVIYAASIVPASMGEQDKYVQNTIDSLTPIELPSDEYIDEVFQPMTELHQYYKDGFINGAKWMKEQLYDGVRLKRFIKDEAEQILNQNK